MLGIPHAPFTGPLTTEVLFISVCLPIYTLKQNNRPQFSHIYVYVLIYTHIYV